MHGLFCQVKEGIWISLLLRHMNRKSGMFFTVSMVMFPRKEFYQARVFQIYMLLSVKLMGLILTCSQLSISVLRHLQGSRKAVKKHCTCFVQCWVLFVAAWHWQVPHSVVSI